MLTATANLYYNLNIIEPHNIIKCDSCRPIKSSINVDCINYDKSNKLITDLHTSTEPNKQVLKVVELERSSMLYLIQTVNSDLMKLKIKSDSVVDTDIQN